ncbi:MAG: GDSL-type esterase/lipase family protein [Actinomycetota bacterium]
MEGVIGRWSTGGGVRVAAVAALAVVVAAGAALWSQRNQGGTHRASIGPGSVVLLGDSLTEEGDWDALLPGRPVSNQGYSGFTSAELVPVAEDVAAGRPRLVLILAGTNDIRDDQPPDWTEANLSEILDRLEAAGPSTTVILQTLLPRDDARAEVLAANERVVALAEARGLAIIDLHPVFDDGAGGLRPAETRDGLHLTDAGYQLWRQALEPVLDAELGPVPD